MQTMNSTNRYMNTKSALSQELPRQESDEARRIAHDIRNSISVLSVNLSLIRRKTGPEVEQRLALLEAELVVLNEMVEALRESYRNA